MSDSLAAGKNNGTSPYPDITCNVQGARLLIPLLTHRNVCSVNMMPTSQEEDILSHQEIIINGNDSVQRFEILSQSDMVANGEIASPAKICALFDNQSLTPMSFILVEQSSANPPSDPSGDSADQRSRGLGEEPGE